MMVRSLSFATFLVAAPAFAEPIPEAQAAMTTQQAANVLAGVQGQWSTSIENGVLVARLTLVNTSSQAVDILSKRGNSPGAYAQARIGGENLEAVYSKSEMGDMFSRMGPRPTYAPLAAKKSLVMGTYRFTLPEGYTGGEIELEAHVEGPMGASVQLATTIGSKAGS